MLTFEVTPVAINYIQLILDAFYLIDKLIFFCIVAIDPPIPDIRLVRDMS